MKNLVINTGDTDVLNLSYARKLKRCAKWKEFFGMFLHGNQMQNLVDYNYDLGCKYLSQHN